jgi:hypothetical protein
METVEPPNRPHLAAAKMVMGFMVNTTSFSEHSLLKRTTVENFLEGAGDGAAGCAHMRQKEQ